jgi:hypothetical protein
MWEISLRILAKSAVTLAGRHYRAGACRAGNDLESMNVGRHGDATSIPLHG